MKKLLLLSLLLFAFGGLLSAQEVTPPIPPPLLPPVEDNANDEYRFYEEYPWALGGCFEIGRNARTDMATGYGISLDRYLFTQYVALGVRGAMHSDGETISATEALLNLRVYKPIRNSNTALFVQWGFGYGHYAEEGREKNTYTMDFLVGSRFYINQRILRGFYIEPYIRAGFPFVVSGGLMIGHWFSF
jgi:hypothetical protein